MTWTCRALLGFVALTFAAGQASADCKNPFANPNEVLDFHIKMSKADWQAIKDEDATKANADSDNFNPAACFYKYRQYKAEFRCGKDEPWIKISLRKKRGQERGNESPEKPPLKIDFNDTFGGDVPEAKDQSWPATFGDLGYRKLTLANGQGNKPPNKVENLMLPILMTEHVTLRLLKQEIPAAASAAYATLTMHVDGNEKGQYIGVYGVVEDIDKASIKRNFGNNDGRLVKSTKDNCTNELLYSDPGPNAASDAFDAFMNLKPEENVGKWLEEAEKGLDIEGLLRQEAIREILVNGDDTILTAANRTNEGLNYYYFDPKKGVRHYIPWDVDLTFGQQNGNCQGGPMSTASPKSVRLMCAPDEPLFRWCPDSLSELGKRTVCVKKEGNQEIKKRYLEIMCQLTNGSLSADKIVELWDQVHDTLAPLVPKEADLVWEGMDPTDESIPKSFGAEYARLRDWIPERIKSVQAQINANGVVCKAGCEEDATEDCDYLGCKGERTCTDGVWSTCKPVATCARPQPKTLVAPAQTAPPGGCSVAPQGGSRSGRTGLGIGVSLLFAVAATLTARGLRRRG